MSDAAGPGFQRAEYIPQGYSPWRHLAGTFSLALGIALFALWLARSARPIDWLLMPAFFFVANFVEWAVHKGPMHRPAVPRMMYTNHALIHHRAFHHDTMPVGDARELGLVFMPWYTMLGLFVVVSPVALAAAVFRGWGVAGIFYLTAALYFVTYEVLHGLYHVPPATLRRYGLGGRLFRVLSRHHTHHHRLDRMAHVNFNVTFPIMDLLFGTRETEQQCPVPRRHSREAEVDAGQVDAVGGARAGAE